MYLINTITGEVIESETGLVVSPCQSTEDPAFIAYNIWANAGNNPTPITGSVAAPITPAARMVTKLEFRRRFNLAERMAVDSAPDNPDVPVQVRLAVRTLLADLALAENVHLDDPDTIYGINFLAQVGLITPARATEILA